MSVAALCSTPSLEERKKEAAHLHRRRRSSDLLETMESMYGDLPVQKPTGPVFVVLHAVQAQPVIVIPLLCAEGAGGTPVKLHEATVVFGKPSEINVSVGCCVECLFL